MNKKLILTTVFCSLSPILARDPGPTQPSTPSSTPRKADSQQADDWDNATKAIGDIKELITSLEQKTQALVNSATQANDAMNQTNTALQSLSEDLNKALANPTT